MPGSIPAPIYFSFDGRTYAGYDGDTLASALLANGVAIVGRSFKMHRPRGVFARRRGRGQCVRATGAGRVHRTERTRDIAASLPRACERSGQNAWPNVRFDAFAVIGLFRRLLPASFYYKTFKWPSWHTWEGTGPTHMPVWAAPPAQADSRAITSSTCHTEVLVVGAGRSGLMAGLRRCAIRTRVLLIDDREEPGGSLLASPVEADGPGWSQARRELARATT